MSEPHERSVLDPHLPFHLGSRADAAVRDVQLQQFVNSTTTIKDRGRVETCGDAFGDAYDEVRTLAGDIKQETLEHLDVYLDRFVDRATEAGTIVHFAADAAEAREICTTIAREAGCSVCVKSKSMVTEEIHLLPALEAAGITTLETDLGEFIIQLDDDAPSHIVSPMIHKDRTSVARAFQRELDAPYTEEPETLTAIAREHMRSVFQAADLGITGGNFLVAETGSVVVCTNEGNADLTVSTPRVQIAVVGIEKMVPDMVHLAPYLKLLARSATSQRMTVYTTIINGPRRPDEVGGPDAQHIVLVDNGRTNVLHPETRDLLRCIRCGACLNACPVYRKVGGGHAYGAVYSGPIGAVLTPLLKGLHAYPDLPHASSLCGACYEACPVKIDLPHHLLRLREKLMEARQTTWRERVAMRMWAAALRRPWAYRLSQRVQRFVLRRSASDGWITRGPRPLHPWTQERDFPAPAARRFRDWWDARDGERS